jgi:hypothetical protein
MRFKEKTRLPHGTLRTKRRFLLWPKKILREVRWLEMATWEEEYDEGVIAKDWVGQPSIYPPVWRPTKWV